VTGSGTGGITEVWDRRKPNEVLHTLCHGEPVVAPIPGGNREDDDTGVQCALWGPTNDRLYTGSSDGKVKVWDIKRGDPFIRDLCSLDSQVMSGAFSPDYDMLMIGECSGRATLLSMQRNQEPFSVVSQVVANDINDIPEEESAAEAARQLVRSGKMMIRDGMAWATGINES
jgi:WD40 repeat protein